MNFKTLKSDHSELAPAAAARELTDGAVLIDIRSDGEVLAGLPADAVHIPDPQPTDLVRRFKAQKLMILCAKGQRSLLLAERLSALHPETVYSVSGGYAAWLEAGLPVLYPDPEEAGFTPLEAQRYARHFVLPEIGMKGQQRLKQSQICLIGAGGLGSPAALYLAAAGVGTIIIVDDDLVSRSNLQRQVLHGEAAVGMAKTKSAEAKLKDINPDINIVAINQRLNSGNIEALFHGVDLVIDGSDNFPTRYLIADACLKLGLPLVYGAVMRFAGQVSLFHPAAQRGVNPCYRCLFPEPPAAADAPDCSTAGVLGVLPGVIGMLQATEAVKFLLDIGASLNGRLLRFDALQMTFSESSLPADPACNWCAPGKAFPGYIDYKVFCNG